MNTFSSTPEKAIRTGGWCVPREPTVVASRDRPLPEPSKFYLVFDQAGSRVGCISYSATRPALEHGGPTYLLKRPTSCGGNISN